MIQEITGVSAWPWYQERSQTRLKVYCPAWLPGSTTENVSQCMLLIAHLNYGVKFIDVHYPRISITNSYWDVKSLTVFGHQALLHWPHKSSCISSLRIVWTRYRLTSPVTLKQFISITKNPTGFGNVSNNKIPVKSSKSHWRLWSSCYKSPLAFYFSIWNCNSLLAES